VGETAIPVREGQQSGRGTRLLRRADLSERRDELAELRLERRRLEKADGRMARWSGRPKCTARALARHVHQRAAVPRGSQRRGSITPAHGPRPGGQHGSNVCKTEKVVVSCAALVRRIDFSEAMALAPDAQEVSTLSTWNADRDFAGAPRPTRRAVLQGALAATIMAAAGGARAQDKAKQNLVQYQERPKGDQECDKCVFWAPPDSCKVVEGKISPKGWCALYAPKPK
jgi:hypothetical protein